MEHVTLLIADDHPMFRKGMRAMMDSIPEVEVIGEASDGEEAVGKALSLQPDVVLMDLQMPNGGGLEATKQINKASPNIHILVVTLFEDDESIFTALRAGAHGYVLKDADEEELLRAVRAVARGEAIFSPAVAARLMDYFASSRKVIPQEVFPELTDREREILTLIARGHTSADIASQLSITQKTVRNHQASIYSKLQVADRTQAAIMAREAGLN